MRRRAIRGKRSIPKDGMMRPRNEEDWLGVAAERRPIVIIITGTHTASERY